MQHTLYPYLAFGAVLIVATVAWLLWRLSQRRLSPGSDFERRISQEGTALRASIERDPTSAERATRDFIQRFENEYTALKAQAPGQPAAAEEFAARCHYYLEGWRAGFRDLPRSERATPTTAAARDVIANLTRYQNDLTWVSAFLAPGHPLRHDAAAPETDPA